MVDECHLFFSTGQLGGEKDPTGCYQAELELSWFREAHRKCLNSKVVSDDY